MDTSQIPLPGIVTHLTRPPPRRHRPGPSEHRSRNHYRIPFRHCIPSSSFSLTGAAVCRPKLGNSGPKARSLGMPTHARSRLSRAPYWTAAAAAAPPPRLAKTTTAFASFRSYRFQPNDVIAPKLPLSSPKLWVSLSIRAGRQAEASPSTARGYHVAGFQGPCITISKSSSSSGSRQGRAGQAAAAQPAVVLWLLSQLGHPPLPLFTFAIKHGGLG